MVSNLGLSRPSLGEGMGGNERAAWSSKESRVKFRFHWVHVGPECLGLIQAVVYQRSDHSGSRTIGIKKLTKRWSEAEVFEHILPQVL